MHCWCLFSIFFQVVCDSSIYICFSLALIFFCLFSFRRCVTLFPICRWFTNAWFLACMFPFLYNFQAEHYNTLLSPVCRSAIHSLCSLFIDLEFHFMISLYVIIIWYWDITQHWVTYFHLESMYFVQSYPPMINCCWFYIFSEGILILLFYAWFFIFHSSSRNNLGSQQSQKSFLLVHRFCAFCVSTLHMITSLYQILG